jgi:peptide methionine sulfoxide reductase MsrA
MLAVKCNADASKANSFMGFAEKFTKAPAMPPMKPYIDNLPSY